MFFWCQYTYKNKNPDLCIWLKMYPKTRWIIRAILSDLYHSLVRFPLLINMNSSYKSLNVWVELPFLPSKTLKNKKNFTSISSSIAPLNPFVIGSFCFYKNWNTLRRRHSTWQKHYRNQIYNQNKALIGNRNEESRSFFAFNAIWTRLKKNCVPISVSQTC